MIVSSVTESSVQPNNTAFKAIRRSHFNYNSSQRQTMLDITNKLRYPINEDSRVFSMEEKLTQKGFDVYLSDSIIKDGSIDVFLAKRNTGKIISVGTYDEFNFDINDVETAIEDDKKFDKIALGFILGVAMAALALCGFKSCNLQKSQQEIAQKVITHDSVNTLTKPVKNIFNKVI